METILKKFWSNYLPYQLHPEDRDYLGHNILEYCLDSSIDDMRSEYDEDLSSVSINKEFKEDSSKNNKILSRLLPVPFFGNVLHAKVYILTGNPGFATWCFIEDYENREHINLLQENLKLSMKTPFNIHPSLATTGGYGYWKPKYERIINAVANKSGWNRTEAEKMVHENVAVIESIAYHSNKRPPNALFNLPSSQLTKEFVQNYVLKRVRSNQAMIFAWRAASHWELDADEDNVLVRNPRAAIGDISPDEIDVMGDFIVQVSLVSPKVPRESTEEMKARTYNIYVIELKKDVLKHKKFREKNPNYIEGKSCVYVGCTSKTPEERYKEHKTGARNKRGRLYNTYVKKYGMYLRPSLYRSHNPLYSQKKAKDMEKEKARRLRNRGYGVWQN